MTRARVMDGPLPAKPVRFSLTRFNEIKLDTSRAYLVKGLIPREGLTIVWGPPKCGKTFLVSDSVLHVALGWDYRGRRVHKGTVIYIACEGERGLAARLEAFRTAKMSDQAAPPDFYLLTTRLGLASDFRQLIDEIRLQLGEGGCDAIVIDTLNRSIEGSENDDADMGRYLKAADAIRETFNCAVIIIHHCGISSDRPRGHTSLTGAADAQIAVKRDASGRIVATVEFMKDGADGDEIVSTLRVIEVGIDEDGEPITSCVVDAVDDGPAKIGKPGRVTGAAAKNALELLRRAIAEAGEVPPASNHIPNGTRAVSDDLWRRYCYEGSISDGGSESARRKAFARSAATLKAAGVIGVWNGWVWLIERDIGTSP